MTALATPPPFSFSALLRLTVDEFIDRPGHYCALALIYAAPGLMLQLFTPVGALQMTAAAGGEVSPQEFGTWISVAVLVSLVVTAAMIGSFTYSVVSSLRGAPISLVAALGHGIGSITHGVALGLALAAGLALLTVPAAALPLALGASADAANSLVLILVLTLVFALMIRFFVAWNVAVAESAWPLQAIRRSIFLTDGSRMTILGVFVALVIGTLLASLVIGGLVALLMTPVIRGGSPEEGLRTIQAVGAVASAPVSAFSLMIPATAYFLLSVEKDRRNLQDAQVFE
ncbi:MAG: hypothetical protein AAF909_02395 [Pseudomonadota bacterium]